MNKRTVSILCVLEIKKGNGGAYIMNSICIGVQFVGRQNISSDQCGGSWSLKRLAIPDSKYNSL